MAITQSQKEEVSRLLDNLNLGTKKAELGTRIVAMIDASGGAECGTVAWSEITSRPTTFPPGAATASAIGGVKQGVPVAGIANPASATPETVARTLNALLDSLKGSGAIA